MTANVMFQVRNPTSGTNTEHINYAINIGGVFYIDTNQNVHIGDLLSHNSLNDSKE